MRTISEDANHFHGTHKGATLEIELDEDDCWYIIVRWKDGGLLYDGWAPDNIFTLEQAKAEAVRGACL